MYTLETKTSFDSAHFLSGYQGKCGNIHGHRWTVCVTIQGDRLAEDTQNKGMVMDFSDLKHMVQELGDAFDHCFIVETGSLKSDTLSCLVRDGFRIVEVDFRPTAENFARYFYDELKIKGCPVQKVAVYETPNNCAVYSEV